MKKHNLYTLAAVTSAAIIFNFSSCKYEDGPKISLKSKKGRLVGEWKLDKINDENPRNVEISMEFEKDGDFKMTYSYSYYGYTYDYNQKGEWEWEDNKETIDLDFDGWHEEYEVKRLTNTELWVENSYDDEMEFEKK